MKSVPRIAMLGIAPALIGFMPAFSHASAMDRPCTCRNRDGINYELGRTVCIRIGDVAYLARCEMELNVTTWRKVQDGCPEADARRARPGGR